jgi:hypothetical protein
MSRARLKRIEALEARQETEAPWTDPAPLALTIWAAIQANLDATKAASSAVYRRRSRYRQATRWRGH